MPYHPTNSPRAVHEESHRRLRYLAWIMMGFMVLILVRLFWIQVIHREPWVAKANIQHQKRFPIPAERGMIYDRNMNILAMELPQYHLAFDDSFLKDRRSVATQLTHILGGSEQGYLRLFSQSSGRRFVYIKRDLTDAQREKVARLKASGLILEKQRRRVRPYGGLARQIIGILDAKERALGGVEEAFDTKLRGRDGWAIYQKDALRECFPSPEYPVDPPVPGCHVQLTLDQASQTILEEELLNGIKNYQAKSGCAVLMNPYSGEVIGMATVWADGTESDTLHYERYLQNMAVEWDFEPGSTFKIVTAAAALEEGLFTPESRIYCENGVFQVGPRPIRDHQEKFGWLTFSEVIERSSNIGTVKIAKALGRDRLYRYIRDFGFGTVTHIDLPREVNGVLPPVYRWNEFTQATIAFGQGISTSAIQLACMTAVIANGGELVRPFVVRSVIDHKGKVLSETRPSVVRRVISEETAAKMRIILERVVTHGNGRLAGVTGCTVAGKTGTAEKSLPGMKGYAPGIHVASFVGFWPSDSPQYVLVVILDEPRHQYWAARSAAPVFARIVDRIIGLHKGPVLPEPTSIPKATRRLLTTASVTGVPGRSEKQVAPPSPSQRQESKVLSPYHVPDLRGLSLRDALRLCGELGIPVEADGSGRVVSQTPKPGTRIDPARLCRILCREDAGKESTP